MQELKKIIQSLLPISERAIQEVVKITEVKSLKNGTLFIERGKRNASEYFLIEGICRSFLLSPEGEEVTLSFFNSGTVLSPHVTRTQDHRSVVNFQALTDITVGEMNEQAFLELMITDVETREFGNMVLRTELMKKVQKEIHMASLTAKDRLRIFREEFPGFENIVPHPTIATYLGITNVSLSRLRKERI